MSYANSARTNLPLLTLTRSLHVSLSPACLLLATIGLGLTNLIWFTAGIVWPPSRTHTSALVQLSTIDALEPLVREHLSVVAADLPIDPVVGVPASFVVPFAKLFETGQSWTDAFGYLMRGVIHVVVWSFFGLAICRMAVIRCGSGESCSIRDAFSFSKRKWSDVAGAPLATLLAIMLIALPIFVVSWLTRFDFGVFVLGLGWIVVLAFACLMAVLVLGLVFGWPLMWGAIATEDSDLFDAISRSFAYTYQNPSLYLRYLVIASCLGVFGWATACFAAELVVHLAYWSVQVGGGAERTEMLRDIVGNTSSADDVWFLATGASAIRVSNSFLAILVSAFSYSFFWSVSGAIYLLLRFDTDQTLEDDIVMGNQQELEGSHSVSSPT